MEGKITPEEESTVIGKLLTHWALWSTLAAASGMRQRFLARTWMSSLQEASGTFR